MIYNGKYTKPSASVPVGGIMIRIAAVLLCLVMISLHLMAGLYAKYTSNGSGEDSARVARFNVIVNGTDADLDVTCTSNEDTYTIAVSNQSEVAVSYTISVDTSLADADSNAVTPVLDQSTGALAPGGQTQHTLAFSVSDWSAFTEGMKGENGEASLSFTVTINIVQVD